MAKIQAPNLIGTGKVDLDEAVFGETFHMSVVHEVVKAELNARRQGSASTLTRGEVSMTGAKAWRQKGTGRARAGALSVPHRTGGGVAFGPKPRHYTVKVNRKARRRALRSALALHAERGSLAILDPAKFEAPSTKEAAKALEKFGEGRALVVLEREGEENAALSFRNLAAVTIAASDDVGVSDIVGASRLVLTTAALERLTKLASAQVRAAIAEGAAA